MVVDEKNANESSSQSQTKEPITEDAANDVAEAIDTFSNYQISPSLPLSILKALRTSASARNVVAVGSNAVKVQIDPVKSRGNGDVIEILDDDDVSEESISLPLSIPSHTSPACESALLASVQAPQARNESATALTELALSKALSPLQLEGACLAIQRHQKVLNSTTRAGFFLGDAAGVGKGRQIAAVLRDSFCRGRTRHLWVSVSRELCRDAQRDLTDLGCHCPVWDGTDLFQQKSGGLGSKANTCKGVLFVTYALLVIKGGKRMDEIIQWVTGTKNATDASFDGVIVFDEAHKAKNLAADTHTAKFVIELQQRLPMARVMYCSATGVSDISHMVYANRLLLWGPGTLFSSFEQFSSTLSNRGTGALELLALEMKQMGTFIARTLSWDGAEFQTLEIGLDNHQVLQYNQAVKWWMRVENELKGALQLTEQTSTLVWRNYWSAHQRFFREICICAKIGRVVQDARIHLEQNYAVVIGLQTTGEAGTQTALSEHQLTMGSDELTSLLSTARSIMTSFVRNHFPVAPPPLEPPKVPSPPAADADAATIFLYRHLHAEAMCIQNLAPPEPLAILVECQRRLVGAANLLDLPPNPLDNLIDQLGGQDQVAELTGRSGRVLRDGTSSSFRYCKRMQESSSSSFGLDMPKSQDDCDKLNIVEKKQFMDGRKSVAIISDAASTGISLHAALGSGAAHKRRVHFTIELPWAADKAIQQLGRTHRSGQLSAPIYKMVVTDLGGERRFGAAVAKRMANLGALTKGDRRAATGSDLSAFDIDSLFGRRALTRVYQCLMVGGVALAGPLTCPSRNGQFILEEYVKQAMVEDLALLTELCGETHRRTHALRAARKALENVGLSSETSKRAGVKSFLNRIAGVPVQEQKLVFGLFMSTLDDVVADAKATGEFEGSVEDVKATRIERFGEAEKLAVDRRSGAPTVLAQFTLDRGISLESMMDRCLADNGDTDQVKAARVAESGFYVSKRNIAGRQLVLYAKRKVEPTNEIPGAKDTVHDPLGLMVVSRPNTGKNRSEMSTKDLRRKYELKMSSNQIRQDLQQTREEDATDSHDRDSPEDLNESKKESVTPEAAIPLDTEGTDKIETTSGSGEKKAVEKFGLSRSDGSRDNAQIAVLRHKSPQVARLWEVAYSDSDSLEPTAGLAPRRARLGLITGAVLHVMPALEKAVVMRSQAERALRVARIELTESCERIVGIRFPTDTEVLVSLKTILSETDAAKSAATGASTVFRDEPFSPICEKSKAWATTERKTMRTFFAVSPKPVQGSSRSEILGSKRPASKLVSAEKSATANKQKRNKVQKTAGIQSFFGKK